MDPSFQPLSHSQPHREPLGGISVVFLRRSATRGDRRSPHGIFAQESLRFLRIEARLLALALSVHLRQYKPNFLSNGGATGRKRW
jgi:hypothetical protein